ncbi:MAG: hypothetical protein NVS1B13_18690 [Flavisolibacter sp.]
MRIKVAAQNLLEWVALKANLIPLPLIHTQILPLLAKAILEAHTLSIFECMVQENKTLSQISHQTGLDEKALRSLLNVLVAAHYLHFAKEHYGLTTISRKWSVKQSANGLTDQQEFNQVTWHFMDHLQDFLKTGKGLQYHETFNAMQWERYQKGMMNMASIASKSIIKFAPHMHKPIAMLDVGGSHGLFSLQYVQKYPSLTATILDLPEAVEKAEPLLRKVYHGKNIIYKPGNALTDDLGEEKYDIILMASLMHHFTEEQNYMVAKKIARALKPGGYFIIHEFLRPKPSKNMEVVGTVMDLFFSLSSTSGNFGAEEYIDFQQKANLKHRAIKKFFTIPGLVQVIAQKS